MITNDINQVAEKFYETYCAAVGGKAFNGDPLPSWQTFHDDETKLKQVAGWYAVAVEAIRMGNR